MNELHAYGKLLRLRSGVQVQVASLFEELPDGGDGLLAADDATSVAVHQLSHFNEGKLERLFLDRLAELFANVKDVRDVAASLMVEWPDRVDGFVSRNEGIDEEDLDGQFLKTLELHLRTIARVRRIVISAHIRRSLGMRS